MAPSDLPSDMSSDTTSGTRADSDEKDEEEDEATLNERIKAKYEGSRNITTKIPGDYLVVFNKTRVKEVKGTFTEYLKAEGVNLTKAYEYLMIAKIKIVENFGTGNTTEERYFSLIRKILASDLVTSIEEVRICDDTQFRSKMKEKGNNGLFLFA
jgi:hypothetical protein